MLISLKSSWAKRMRRDMMCLAAYFGHSTGPWGEGKNRPKQEREGRRDRWLVHVLGCG